MKKAFLLAVLALGCSAPTFDPSSKIESLRILATRADKPYSAPGDMVMMSVLAVDGRASPSALATSALMKVYWLPSACVDPPGDAYFECFPPFAQSFRPGVNLESSVLTVGTDFSFRMPADAITSHAPPASGAPYGVAVVFTIACTGHVQYLPPSARGGGADAVPFGCFDDGGARLGAGDFVFAYSLVYAFTDRTNANPEIRSVTFGGMPVDPKNGITVDHCTQADVDNCPTTPIDVTIPASNQELDPSNSDALGHVLKEEIYVDYYLTGGKVRNDVMAIFDPRAGRLAGTNDDFFAPQEAGEYWFWAVVHDNRGGVSWQDFALHAR